MKPGLTMGMGRQLTVGPMLQKSLKLLQMNSLDFARELNAFAQSNPLLEIEEPVIEESLESIIEGFGLPQSSNMSVSDATLGARADQQQLASVRTNSEPWGHPSGHPKPDSAGRSEDWMASIAVQGDLRSHLRGQIIDSLLPAELEDVCFAVIDSVDDRGYLDDAPAVLGRHFRDLGMTASDSLVEEATRLIRSLEPAGIGAMSLSDCLTLQLDRLTENDSARLLASVIVSEHLEFLAQGNAKTIARETGSSLEEVRDSIALIQRLNPSPGREFDNGRVDYIVPELAVRKVDNRWCVQPLRGCIPRVRVNKLYADILTEQGRDLGNQSIKEKLQEARWLVKNMEQRDETIFAVGQAIVHRQSQYFDHGEIALKPMTLADIAADIDMHESTVSRVVSSKYLVCPGGLKPMKMFFTSHVQTNAGDACSASAVKAMIKALVNNEPQAEPYSDHKLAQLLARQGVKIARRTVSKYRQAMGLRSFELRRQTNNESLQTA